LSVVSSIGVVSGQWSVLSQRRAKTTHFLRTTDNRPPTTVIVADFRCGGLRFPDNGV
jgi:hypothetical protein